MAFSSSAMTLAEEILMEFVEAAEPRRQPKMQRCWWWQPTRRLQVFDPEHPDRVAYWPSEAPAAPPPPPPEQIVSLPMYGARINSRGGDAE